MPWASAVTCSSVMVWPATNAASNAAASNCPRAAATCARTSRAPWRQRRADLLRAVWPPHHINARLALAAHARRPCRPSLRDNTQSLLCRRSSARNARLSTYCAIAWADLPWLCASSPKLKSDLRCPSCRPASCVTPDFPRESLRLRADRQICCGHAPRLLRMRATFTLIAKFAEQRQRFLIKPLFARAILLIFLPYVPNTLSEAAIPRLSPNSRNSARLAS